MFIPILIQTIIGFLMMLGGVEPDGVEPTPPSTAAPIAPASQPERAPQPEPAPELGEPAHLVVSEGAITLAPNVMSGSFDLTNVGGEPIAWVWVGMPSIGLSQTAGELAAGESVTIHFQIDSSQLQPGSNLLANCIITADQAVDVWITATKFVRSGPGSFTS